MEREFYIPNFFQKYRAKIKLQKINFNSKSYYIFITAYLALQEKIILVFFFKMDQAVIVFSEWCIFVLRKYVTHFHKIILLTIRIYKSFGPSDLGNGS